MFTFIPGIRISEEVYVFCSRWNWQRPSSWMLKNRQRLYLQHREKWHKDREKENSYFKAIGYLTWEWVVDPFLTTAKKYGVEPILTAAKNRGVEPILTTAKSVVWSQFWRQQKPWCGANSDESKKVWDGANSDVSKKCGVKPILTTEKVWCWLLSQFWRQQKKYGLPYLLLFHCFSCAVSSSPMRSPRPLSALSRVKRTYKRTAVSHRPAQKVRFFSTVPDQCEFLTVSRYCGFLTMPHT